MRISELPSVEVRRRFRSGGLAWRVGPFTVRMRATDSAICDCVADLYGDFPIVDAKIVPHVELEIRSTALFRNRIVIDGEIVHASVPRRVTIPLAEWALNVNVFQRPQQFLIIHAAVAERDGLAVVMPGLSGAGKSTLCAALVTRGWRLLSDEVALIRLSDGKLVPVPRPISLKNQAIEIVRNFPGDKTMSSIWKGTVKGDVAYMLPPRRSVDSAAIIAEPRWIVFPSFQDGSHVVADRMSKAKTLLELARNSFNYSTHGRQGFRVLASMVENCNCMSFRYSDLEDAVSFFKELSVVPRHTTLERAS